MLEIHVAETKVQSGAVRIRWCVGKETLQTLDRLGCREPHLLLITVPENGNGSTQVRQIVRLRDLMAYVEFRRAGKNTIHAIILHEGSEKWQRDQFLTWTNRRWNTDVLSSDSEPLERYARFSPEAGPADGRHASLTVDLPKECFAKEPPAWEKAWVNLWFSSYPLDQCSYRRRRLLAYTLQPIVMGAFYAVIAALAYGVAWTAGILLTLCGIRGFDYRLLYWPFAMKDGGTINLGKLTGSWFLPKTSRRWVKFIAFPFTPIFPITAFLFLKFGSQLGWGSAIGYAFLSAIGLTAFVAVFGMLLATIVTAVDKARTEHETVERARLASQPPWYLDDDLLACNGGGGPMSLKDLPKERRSIRLLYLDLKAKVCRPFAG